MKYKVSLLPEKNRKRIVGKRKAEKGRSIANVVMLVLLAGVLLSLCGKLIADLELADIKSKNSKYQNEVVAFQEHKNLDTNLRTKLDLIEKIKISEPALYNFIAEIGNVEHPGVNITNLTCEDWKTTRVCTITGSAMSRESFNAFMDELEKIDGVEDVKCTSYVATVVSDGVLENEFSVTIVCSGGAAPIVSETATTTTADTTAAA